MLNKIKNCMQHFKREQAFSLVELIIVIVIITISIVPLTSIIRVNQRGIGDLAQTIQAEFFAQSVMEEIVADYRSTFTSSPPMTYDDVITYWSAKSVNHPDSETNLSAAVAIVELTDTDTGIEYASVTVGVTLSNGNTVSLVCLLVEQS